MEIVSCKSVGNSTLYLHIQVQILITADVLFIDIGLQSHCCVHLFNFTTANYMEQGLKLIQRRV